MIFRTMSEFYLWLERYKICFLGAGSQGECYKIGNKVYKIFNQFIDSYDDDLIEYKRDEILKFSSIVNNTYVFPSDVIMVGDIVVGYITDYFKGNDLDKINPLSVDLDKFDSNLVNVYSDIKNISELGIRSYDVLYNIMYGDCGFKIVDTVEYTKTDMDFVELYKINMRNFNNGIGLFLVCGYFDEFVNRDNYLSSQYNDLDIDAVMFLKEFRRKLSEFEGYDIKRLIDAKKCISRKRKKGNKYIREI